VRRGERREQGASTASPAEASGCGYRVSIWRREFGVRARRRTLHVCANKKSRNIGYMTAEQCDGICRTVWHGHAAELKGTIH